MQMPQSYVISKTHFYKY